MLWLGILYYLVVSLKPVQRTGGRAFRHNLRTRNINWYYDFPLKTITWQKLFNLFPMILTFGVPHGLNFTFLKRNFYTLQNNFQLKSFQNILFLKLNFELILAISISLSEYLKFTEYSKSTAVTESIAKLQIESCVLFHYSTKKATKTIFFFRNIIFTSRIQIFAEWL